MKSIGGYFELETRSGEHYHKDAIKLCSARNCFEYILLSRKYSKVYLPYYTCSVMLEPLRRHQIDYEFYSINTSLDPIFNKKLKEAEAFLYTNYFGLKDETVVCLAKKFKNLIIDNAQAFFSYPIKGVDTFYSARKFFGVPDGAYLYTGSLLNTEYPTFNPINHCKHLIGRMTYSAEKYYNNFQKSELLFSNNIIQRMSILSDRILASLDYEQISRIRRSNYNILYHYLDKQNSLHFDISGTSSITPMIYPFMSQNENIRKALIKAHIYVPQYWINVKEWVNPNSFENTLSQVLCPLPVDQRYKETEMNSIINEINKILD